MLRRWFSVIWETLRIKCHVRTSNRGRTNSVDRELDCREGQVVDYILRVETILGILKYLRNDRWYCLFLGLDDDSPVSTRRRKNSVCDYKYIQINKVHFSFFFFQLENQQSKVKWREVKWIIIIIIIIISKSRNSFHRHISSERCWKSEVSGWDLTGYFSPEKIPVLNFT